MEENENINIPKFSTNLVNEIFYSFKDGDFIINKYELYDGKSFKLKLTLDYCSYIYILDEIEIALLYESSIQINKFNENRTLCQFIQSIIPNGMSLLRNIVKLLNGDILCYSNSLGIINIEVFRKNLNNNLYENQLQYFIHDLDGVISINKSEALGYRFDISDEYLLFKVFNNENYKVKKQKKTLTQEIITNKKRIYLSKPILIKIYQNKIISTGGNNIYLFDLNNLELETTINITKRIIKILINSKRILLFTFERSEIDENNLRRQEKYYINNLIINYDNNDIKQSNEKDITDKLGEYKTLFKIFNYKDNGLAIINENRLIIYENYEV